VKNVEIYSSTVRLALLILATGAQNAVSVKTNRTEEADNAQNGCEKTQIGCCENRKDVRIKVAGERLVVIYRQIWNLARTICVLKKEDLRW
jgi:hypothetical protein